MCRTYEGVAKAAAIKMATEEYLDNTLRHTVLLTIENTALRGANKKLTLANNDLNKALDVSQATTEYMTKAYEREERKANRAETWLKVLAGAVVVETLIILAR